MRLNNVLDNPDGVDDRHNLELQLQVINVNEQLTKYKSRLSQVLKEQKQSKDELQVENSNSIQSLQNKVEKFRALSKAIGTRLLRQEETNRKLEQEVSETQERLQTYEDTNRTVTSEREQFKLLLKNTQERVDELVARDAERDAEHDSKMSDMQRSLQAKHSQNAKEQLQLSEQLLDKQKDKMHALHQNAAQDWNGEKARLVRRLASQAEEIEDCNDKKETCKIETESIKQKHAKELHSKQVECDTALKVVLVEKASLGNEHATKSAEQQAEIANLQRKLEERNNHTTTLEKQLEQLRVKVKDAERETTQAEAARQQAEAARKQAETQAASKAPVKAPVKVPVKAPVQSAPVHDTYDLHLYSDYNLSPMRVLSKFMF